MFLPFWKYTQNRGMKLRFTKRQSKKPLSNDLFLECFSDALNKKVIPKWRSCVKTTRKEHFRVKTKNNEVVWSGSITVETSLK